MNSRKQIDNKFIIVKLNLRKKNINNILMISISIMPRRNKKLLIIYLQGSLLIWRDLILVLRNIRRNLINKLYIDTMIKMGMLGLLLIDMVWLVMLIWISQKIRQPMFSNLKIECPSSQSESKEKIEISMQLENKIVRKVMKKSIHLIIFCEIVKSLKS